MSTPIKLAEEDVATIFKEVNSGNATVAALAKRYHVTRGTIYSALKRHQKILQRPTAPKGSTPRRPGNLSELEVTEIISDSYRVTTSELAKRYGVSRQSIDNILRGITHANTAPDLPRPRSSTMKCTLCVHFIPPTRTLDDACNPVLSPRRCELDVPEFNLTAETSLVDFAPFCSSFYLDKQTS